MNDFELNQDNIIDIKENKQGETFLILEGAPDCNILVVANMAVPTVDETGKEAKREMYTGLYAKEANMDGQLCHAFIRQNSNTSSLFISELEAYIKTHNIKLVIEVRGCGAPNQEKKTNLHEVYIKNGGGEYTSYLDEYTLDAVTALRENSITDTKINKEPEKKKRAVVNQILTLRQKGLQVIGIQLMYREEFRNKKNIQNMQNGINSLVQYAQMAQKKLNEGIFIQSDQPTTITNETFGI